MVRQPVSMWLQEGKKFRVVVADSRPNYEGKALLTKLLDSGIPCTYIHLNALCFIMQVCIPPERLKVMRSLSFGSRLGGFESPCEVSTSFCRQAFFSFNLLGEPLIQVTLFCFANGGSFCPATAMHCSG